MRPVRKYRFGDRGLVRYGGKLTSTYGTAIEVQSSSGAGHGREVWLKLKEDPVILGGGEAYALLRPKTARELIRRLQTWLDEGGVA